jgi:hypothetical protein
MGHTFKDSQRHRDDNWRQVRKHESDPEEKRSQPDKKEGDRRDPRFVRR